MLQPVGQLDQHDAHVVHHRQEDFAQVLGLLFFPVAPAQLAQLVDMLQLGDAVDQLGDFFAELVAQVIDLDVGVLGHVVEQGGGDGGGVEAQVGQDAGNGQRVLDVRLARGARLPIVGCQRDFVGVPHELCAGPVAAALLAHLFEDRVDVHHIIQPPAGSQPAGGLYYSPKGRATQCKDPKGLGDL